MNRNIWIGIVVLVFLAIGGWWYFNQPSTPAAPQKTSNPSVQPSTSSAPSATIDQSSLSQSVSVNNNGPVITGTAVNATAVEISAGGLLLGSAQVVSGHWSANIANNKMKFIVGSYPIKIYNVSGKDETYIPSDADLMTTGTLVVQ